MKREAHLVKCEAYLVKREAYLVVRCLLFVVHIYSPKGFPFRQKTFPLVGRSCASGMKKMDFLQFKKMQVLMWGEIRKFSRISFLSPDPCAFYSAQAPGLNWLCLGLFWRGLGGLGKKGKIIFASNAQVG